jgi:HAD superfamily hydrolase (TIGR01490 family)
MKKYAFFDVDKTIYKGYTESSFFEYVDENNLFNIKPKIKLDGIKEKYYSRKITYDETVQLIVQLMSDLVKGQSINEVDEVIDMLINNEKEQFEEWFFPTHKILKEKGFQIVLVSGSNEMIIGKLAEIIGKDTLYFATKYHTKDGYYTGNHEIHMNGIEKKKHIQNLIDQHDSTYTIGFGDSPGDIPMLEIVDKAFVFSQEEHHEMEEVAKDKGWVFFKEYEEIESILKNDILK